MVIFNGVKIHPSKYKRALLGHLKVEDAIGFSIRHSVHQDRPVAVAPLKHGDIISDLSKKVREINILLYFSNEYINEKIYLEIAFSVPNMSYEYEKWAVILLGRENWTDNLKPKNLYASSLSHHIYIESILQFYRLLLELGRLPYFEAPKAVSISENKLKPGNYKIKVESLLDTLIPQSVYVDVMNAALQICRWMAHHHPTTENKHKVFNVIKGKVIQPLNRIVPAGKSTIPVLRVAHSLEIPFIHLGLGVYQLGWGSKARKLDRSACEFDSTLGAKLAQNKVSTAAILREAGLPAPVHGVITRAADALIIAKKLGFPVVIKPSDRDRGEGVTTGISTEEELRLAFTQAQQLSRSGQVIVERQVTGTCYRLFIANSRLLYAVKRNPMSVLGDGKRTVTQLVFDEVLNNSDEPPWIRSEIKPMDQLAVQTIRKLNLLPESVPRQGIMVPLRPIESTEWGGVDEDVTQIVNPENLRIALEAAKLFGLHVAGIDIISPDITKPWHANGAIINEVNFAPLLGGADISRSYIPRFLREFMGGNGKIPIEVFENEEIAEAFQKGLRAQGKRCYLTSKDRTVDQLGEEVLMPFKNLKKRIRALILRSDVDAVAVFKQGKKSSS